MKAVVAEETITESCGNVFADLGFENPEEELAKAKLVVAPASDFANWTHTNQSRRDSRCRPTDCIEAALWTQRRSRATD